MSNDIEYEIVQDDMLVASACGDNALNEIKHYAAQYEQDGPIKVYELTRREIDLAAPSVASGAQGELPPLPEPYTPEHEDAGSIYPDMFTSHQMQAYARAAIAAQAKPQQMSDEQILDLSHQFEIMKIDQAAAKEGNNIVLRIIRADIEEAEVVKFARAIIANSAPNKALVEALTQMVSWFGRYPEFVPVPEANDNVKASILSARAALNAAGVAK